MRFHTWASGAAWWSMALVSVAIVSSGWGQVAATEARHGTGAGAERLVWRSVPSMHTARYYAGAALYGERIVAIGGFDAHGTALNSAETYDLEDNRWITGLPMPTARADFGIFQYGRNGPILVLGGADSHGKRLAVVEQYSPPNVGETPNHWTTLPPMPQARRGLAAAQEAPQAPDEGDLMIAGGIGPGGRLLSSVVEEIDNIPKHGDHTWRPLAPMRTARTDFALVVGGSLNTGSGRVYAIGGFGRGHIPLRSVEAYNRRTNRWTEMAPMPTARGGLAAQAMDGGRSITVAGGFDGRGRPLNTVEQYNVATNTWTPLAPMPVARGGLAIIDTNGMSRPGLFTLGGRGLNGAVLASVFARETPLPPGWSLDTPLPQRQRAPVARRAPDGLIYVFGSGQKIDVFNPSTHGWSMRRPSTTTVDPGPSDLAEMMYFVAGRTFKGYDPKTNSWIERAPLPVERFDAAVVTGKDGKVYVLGGYGSDPADSSNRLYRRSLDVYDPATNSWQVKAAMPTAREGLGAAVGTDGTIYAIGGGTDHYDRLFSCSSAVEAFNPGTNTWSRKPSLLQPMCGATAGTTATGAIVTIGGSTVEGGEQGSWITTATGRLAVLKPGAHRWTALSRAPYPRKLAGALIDPSGSVYVIGGADSFGDPTRTVQKYALPGSR